MFSGTFTPVSNRATWSESAELTDDETGEGIDLSALSNIIIEVREQETCNVILSATLNNGVTVVGDPADGVFQWRFESSSMRNLSPKTYDIGCVISQDGDDVQLFVGWLPIVSGVIT